MNQRRGAHLSNVLNEVQKAWTDFVQRAKACSSAAVPTPEQCDALAISAAQLGAAIEIIGERAQEFAGALLDASDG